MVMMNVSYYNLLWFYCSFLNHLILIRHLWFVCTGMCFSFSTIVSNELHFEIRFWYKFLFQFANSSDFKGIIKFYILFIKRVSAISPYVLLISKDKDSNIPENLSETNTIRKRPDARCSFNEPENIFGA